MIPDAAFVAYATPRMPDDALAAALSATGIAVHLAGDCALPQGVLAATAGVYAVGMKV